MTIYRNREKPLGFTFYFRPLNPMFEYQCNKTSLGQSLRKYNGTLGNICVCIIRDSAFSVSYMNAVHQLTSMRKFVGMQVFFHKLRVAFLNSSASNFFAGVSSCLAVTLPATKIIFILVNLIKHNTTKHTCKPLLYFIFVYWQYTCCQNGRRPQSTKSVLQIKIHFYFSVLFSLLFADHEKVVVITFSKE